MTMKSVDPILNIVAGVLKEFHNELIKLQRWDLATQSRWTIRICLN